MNEDDCQESNRGFVCVSRTDTSRGSNVIGSRVVYHRKPEETAKVRDTPWGHRGVKRNDVRGDALTLVVDSMRILHSKVAENN